MGAMTLLHASCTEYLIVCIFCSFRLGHGYGVPDGQSTVVFGPLRRSSALLWEPRATLVAIPPTSEYFFFSIPKIPIISDFESVRNSYFHILQGEQWAAKAGALEMEVRVFSWPSLSSCCLSN